MRYDDLSTARIRLKELTSVRNILLGVDSILKVRKRKLEEDLKSSP